MTIHNKQCRYKSVKNDCKIPVKSFYSYTLWSLLTVVQTQAYMMVLSCFSPLF